MKFFEHPKFKYWNYTLNSEKPQNISTNQTKKYWFKCNNCNHNFKNNIYNIIKKQQWCPYCCFPSQKLCNDKDCMFCFNNSFASNKNSKYWNIKNIILPRNIFKSSNKKHWFDCNKCNHIFERSLCSIKNNLCPYCCIPSQKFCNEKCDFCFTRSFKSHPKSKWYYLFQSQII